MVLKNKLGITDSAELAWAEEKISKKKAVELFESGQLESLLTGTFESLANNIAITSGDTVSIIQKIYSDLLGKS